MPYAKMAVAVVHQINLMRLVYEGKKMEIIRVILKILLWFLIIEFGCNFVMQTISYGFYKWAKNKADVAYTPQYLQMTDTLTGYGYNLDSKADEIILYFGGSDDIAYNSVGTYAGKFDCPFLSADYHGTQKSSGKMNIRSMQQTATEFLIGRQSNTPTTESPLLDTAMERGWRPILPASGNATRSSLPPDIAALPTYTIK